jgi:fructokinase
MALLGIVSPSRVIIGGGVSQSEGLHERIQSTLVKITAGYFPQVLEGGFIAPPSLGQNAGIYGALILADL